MSERFLPLLERICASDSFSAPKTTQGDDPASRAHLGELLGHVPLFSWNPFTPLRGPRRPRRPWPLPLHVRADSTAAGGLLARLSKRRTRFANCSFSGCYSCGRAGRARGAFCRRRSYLTPQLCPAVRGRAVRAVSSCGRQKEGNLQPADDVTRQNARAAALRGAMAATYLERFVDSA